MSLVEIILKKFNFLRKINKKKTTHIVIESKTKDLKNKISKKSKNFIQNKAINSVVLIIRKKIYIHANLKK